VPGRRGDAFARDRAQTGHGQTAAIAPGRAVKPQLRPRPRPQLRTDKILLDFGTR